MPNTHKERDLTALEQSLMAENDALASENAAFRKAEGDSMEVKTAVGSLKARGDVVVLIIVLAIGFGLIYWRLDQHNNVGSARVVTIQTEINALKDTIQENTYVLTLDEKERKSLRLDMPDSLRKRTR